MNLQDLSLDTSIDGWDLAFAGIALIASWIVGRLVHRGVISVLTRVDGVGVDLRLLAARISKYFVWLIGVGVAMSFLGAQIQPLLSAALLVAVIAAVALRGVAENFAAGLVIQSRRPIQIGDHIESLEHSGTVLETNGRSVVIRSFDGQTIHLPNAQVLQEPIVNDSVNGRRRSDIEVRATVTPGQTADLLDLVTETLTTETTETTDDATTPLVTLTAIEPQRATVLVRVWHPDDSGARARSDVLTAIAQRLAEAGIEATVMTPPPPQPMTPPADR